MTLLIAAASAWALLSPPMAVLLGRGIRLADAIGEDAFSTESVERYLHKRASAELS